MSSDIFDKTLEFINNKNIQTLTSDTEINYTKQINNLSITNSKEIILENQK